MRTKLVVVAVAALGVAAGGVTAAAVASQNTSGTPLPLHVSTAGFPSGPRQPGIFTDRCGYSHELADDPILAPGKPGTSMHHNFYGNTKTTANSTAASLVGGPTTCTTTADSSAYWTPVLYQHGVPLTPGTALIYWRRPAGDTDPVHTVPAGLQMIAGDEAATAPQPTTVIKWTCQGVQQMRQASATPHDCPAGQDLRLIVTFPSCWDGHTLGGATQRNVVYREGNGCPASHPVQIPQIVFHVNYPTSSADGLTLSMTPTMQGSMNTEHVDFVSGWNQAVVSADVTACVGTSTRCGPVSGPLAAPAGGKQSRRHHR